MGEPDNPYEPPEQAGIPEMSVSDNPYQPPASSEPRKRRWHFCVLIVLLPIVLFSASWWVAVKDLDRDAIYHSLPAQHPTKLRVTITYVTSSQLLRYRITAWKRTWYVWLTYLLLVILFEWRLVKQLRMR